VPELSEVREAMKASPNGACKLLHNDFAFHIGHYPTPHATSKPGPLRPESGLQAIPILADRPGFDASGAIHHGNSPNHGGQGQNVLFADGHAAWLSSRWVSPADTDLYLNNANRPAYGLGPQDAVLMPASLRINSR
jgi:prepilin-type processing-associated H-X9-DG protein